MPDTHERFLEVVEAELAAAYAKHGREKWSRHEFAAILREECEELWDAIKTDAPMTDVVAEAAQVVAVCIRFVETGDRYCRVGKVDTAEALDLVGAARFDCGASGGSANDLTVTCMLKVGHPGTHSDGVHGPWELRDGEAVVLAGRTA